MPFCPKCGKQVLETDRFCISCGQDLAGDGQTAQQAQAQIPTSPVRAMQGRSLYLIHGQGVVKIGTLSYLIVVPLISGVVAASAVVLGLGLGSWGALAVIFSVLFAPLFAEYRAWRLAKILARPLQELASDRRFESYPWSSVQYLTIKGRKASFKLGSRWVSAKMDEGDAAQLATLASSTLGGSIAAVPEAPPRLSPATKFTLLAMVLFALTQVVTIGASLTPFFPGEQDQYTSLYNSVKQGLSPTPIEQWGQIFGNNFQIALTSLIPGIGVLTLGISSYVTGRVIQAAALQSTNPHISAAGFLFILYILPHSLVEELSYPLAAAFGLYILSWRSQSYSEFANWKTRASTRVLAGVAVVGAILALAAALEVSEPSLGIAALLLWIPVLSIAGYVYWKWRAGIAAWLA